MFTPVARLLVSGLVALTLAFPGSVFAATTVQSVRGDVRANNQPVTQNQQVPDGTTLTTGADSQAILRFDDGQRVVLNQNTEFRIVEFRYSEQAEPSTYRAVFDFLKGAARIVTGTLGRRNQAAFQLRAPQATIGIRGTDFMLVIVNPLYLNVTQGAITAANSAGTVPFAAGAIGQVTSATALATTIPASALPAAASSAFSSMSSVVVSAAGGAATGAAGTATGAATGGVGFGTAAAVGAAAAAAAAAGGGGGNSTTTHH